METDENNQLMVWRGEVSVTPQLLRASDSLFITNRIEEL